MEALAAASLAAGLLGGVHCVGMCGGIAGALSAAARGPAWRRIAAFNAGRIASYSVAGAAAGGIGGAALALGPAGVIQAALFVAANALVVAMGFYVAGIGSFVPRLEMAGRGLWRRLEPLRRRLVPIDSDAKAFGAGTVWGWLPCGLVYAMLPLATASGSPVQGALVLAAFGLGTLPSLVLAGSALRALAVVRNNEWVRRAAGFAIAGLGVAALVRMPAAADLIAAGWRCIA